MIIDSFSQSYNPLLVFASLDIPDLFPDRKDLPYGCTCGKCCVQRFCIPLDFSLLLCIPFSLTFLNDPVCTSCHSYSQFPLSSIAHKIDYFFPTIVPYKTSQFTHPIATRFTPSHRSGTHPLRIHAAHMPFCTTPQDMFVMECSLDILPVPHQILPALLYCTVTSFTMILDPCQKFF